VCMYVCMCTSLSLIGTNLHPTLIKIPHFVLSRSQKKRVAIVDLVGFIGLDNVKYLDY